jgi:hypothetical protein
MKAIAALLIVCAGATAARAADAPDARLALERLFADERAFVWREDPLSATNDGVHDYDDRLPRVTPADQRAGSTRTVGSSSACTASTAAPCPNSTR